jgi:hypothetical protein
MRDKLLLEGEPFSFQPEFDREVGIEDSAAEKAQRKEADRDCKGFSVLEWLEKDGPSSLREYIAYLERRLTATPRLVQAHQNLRKLKGMRLPKDKFSAAWQGLVNAFPEIKQYYFPRGYNVGTVDEEVAQIRCKLSRARLSFQIWHRTGKRPKEAGFVRLCSPPPRPGGPLILWTIDGFNANDKTLNKSQLAEIELIARAMARNPRTHAGKPVLTLAGGYAPGEQSSVGDGRAIAVKNALMDALKQIDVSLLGSVGFVLVAEAWCSEVSISMRERVPQPPDLRIRPDSPVIQPPNLGPTGTPLPPAPPARSPSGRSAQDLLRERIDGVLRKHGVKSAAVRKAIADSAIFQGEEALRAAANQADITSATKKAIVESIRALSRGRPQ